MKLVEAVSHNPDNVKQAIEHAGIAGLNLALGRKDMPHVMNLMRRQTQPYFKNVNELNDDPFIVATMGTRGINHYLVHGQPRPDLKNPEQHIEHYKEQIGQLHSAFRKTIPLPEHTVTYMGISVHHAKTLSTVQPGEIVNFPAISSTTVKTSNVYNFAKADVPEDLYTNYKTRNALAFHIEKGTPHTAFYVGSYSQYPHEYEMIVRPGVKAAYSHTETFIKDNISRHRFGDKYVLHHFNLFPHEDQQ